MSRLDKKRIVVVSLELAIAACFVAGGGLFDLAWQRVYQSYFADVALPFGFYFLLSLNEASRPVLRRWWVKALAVFVLCATSETLQYFGIYALARVFDPLDYVMYGAGVLLAALVETQVFARVFGFWRGDEGVI